MHFFYFILFCFILFYFERFVCSCSGVDEEGTKHHRIEFLQDRQILVESTWKRVVFDFGLTDLDAEAHRPDKAFVQARLFLLQLRL
jgi:hypothetical protein